MKKFNIDFPISGVLHFFRVEAETKEEAIKRCYELVDESDNPMVEFEGEWDMYRWLVEGHIVCVNDYTVSVRK